MTNNNYTYKNWLEGKFELTDVYIIKDVDANNKLPRVNPLSIQDDELAKINCKQQELFESLISEYKNKLIKDFNKRYTESSFPKQTLKIQVNDIIAIVRGQKQKFNNEDYIVEKTGQLIPKSFLVSFQNYMNLKLKGLEKTPNFIPSPNSKLFNYSKYILPEVYLESMIMLYKHLSKFDSSIDPSRLFQDPYRSLYDEEPFNESPDVFVSGYGLHLFRQIEEALIILPARPGDYVLIHKMLIHSLTNAIKSDVSLEKFFKYVNSVNGISLKPSSNKPSTSELKKNIICFFLRRYFYKTQSHSRTEIENFVKKVIDQKTA